MSDRLTSYLMGFLSATGLEGEAPVAPDFDDALRRLGTERVLRVQSLYDWPEAAKAALQALITDWAVILEYSSMMDAPGATGRRFLEDTSSTRLGAPVIEALLQKAPDLMRMHRFRQEAMAGLV